MNESMRVDGFAVQPHRPTESRHYAASQSAIRDLLQAFRRHLVAVFLWTALCLGAAIAYLIHTPPEYTASTSIILDSRRAYAGGAGGQNGSAFASLDTAQADSQIQVIKSERLLRTTFDALHLGDTAQSLPRETGLYEQLKDFLIPNRQRLDPKAEAFLSFMGKVGARRVGVSYVIEISYRAPTADEAVRTANSITAAYIWDQIATNAASAQRGGEFLQSRISDFTTEQAEALAGVAAGKIPDRRFPDADARVIGAAMKPLGKSSPQTGLVLLFALSFGLVSGFLVIFVRSGLDRSIRTRMRLAELMSIECLGVIPIVSKRDPWQLLDQAPGRTGPEPSLDAFRNLSIALAGTIASDRRAIGVVAWNKTEGVSTVAAGLACVLANTGERAVLIDGNHRETDQGLTRRLSKRVPVAFDRMHVSSEPAADQWVLKNDLHFVPVNPAEQRAEVSYKRLNDISRRIGELRDHWVIVDLPALSTAGDVRMLGPSLDAVILVVDAHRTSIEDVKEAASSLSARANLIGIVLNKTAAKPSRSRRLRRT